MSLTPTAELLAALVRIPSPSGEEGAVAQWLEQWARKAGLDVRRDDAAVRIEVVGARPGPTLLLASHLDTVPAGDAWEIDPFAAEVRDGALWGRGAVDAKGPLSAMCAAAARLGAEGGPRCGRLLVLATYGEETRHTSMPRALEALGALPDAAVVGEPTGLEPCIAQRGLLILEAIWSGRAVHAGWAAELGRRPDSALDAAVRGLPRLAETELAPIDPLLGATVATPTVMRAGEARNVTPERATAVLDVRTTPAADYDVVRRRLSEVLGAEIRVISDRLRPARTPDDSRLLALFGALRPSATPFASPTSSDWVFLREVDAIKLGPGDSRLSHTSREAMPLDEVERATGLYLELARNFLA